MAEADIGRIKRNIQRMIDLNAPETEIDEYVASEGVSIEQLQAPKQEEKPEPDLTAGRVAGLGTRAGIQAAPSMIAGLPALAYDGTIGFLENMGRQAYNLGARALGAEEVQYRDPFKMTNAVSKLGEMGADALDLPKPETAGERIAVGAGQTALEALGGAKVAAKFVPTSAGQAQQVLKDLAEAPITQGVVGGLAGGGAQVAAESDVNPLIGMGAGLALGIGGSAVPVLARQGIDTARNVMDRTLLRGENVIEDAARARVRNAASDPDAALRELEEGAGGELVAGSRPTTFQATGDMGLGSFERDLQTANPGAFADRRASQNSARLESLRSVQGSGNSDEIVSFLRSQLDDIDRMTAGDEASARAGAEASANAIRPLDDAEGLGRSLRGSMSDAEEAARKRESALWSAVDPDGSLTVSVHGAKQIAHELYQKMTKAGGLGVTREERAISELLQSYKSVETFREVLDLRSQIEAAKREELARRGRTATYNRLTQLSQAVQKGMMNSAAERIASDPLANNRFTAFVNDWQQTGAGAGTSASNSAYGAVRAGGVSGMAGASSSQGGKSGPAARGAGVQGKARGKPLSLTQFIAKNGGLPLDAEAAARDWGSVSVGRFGRLARSGGRSVDGYWRNKLIDAGYLPKDADGYASRDITKELYDAIEQERAGRRSFTASDEMEMDLPGGGEAEDLVSAAKQIREELQAVGVRPDEVSARAVNDAAELLARGDETDAVTAYERAVMGIEDEGPVRAEYAPREASAPSAPAFEGLRDDTEAGKRYRSAADATRENRKTYGKGYAGQILRPGDDRSSFRMGDASVSRNAFMPGPTGGERVKSIVRAGGRLSDIAEMAALSLHKHIKDGLLDPKGFETWRKAHAQALKELPEDVRARFANASLASKALEQAAARRKTALDEFSKSVLGKIAKIDTADLPKEIGKVLNSSDAAAKMRKLSQAAGANPSAKEGLRRAVGEYIQERFISNKEVGTSGENNIKADAFASFVKDKQAALRMVFDGEHLLRMQSIADDIKRAERSLYAVKTPGQSNTAQDMGSVLDRAIQKAREKSMMTQLVISAGSGAVLGVPGIVAGPAAVLGVRFLGNMRAAGLKKVDDLVLEIMLDPQLAKAALLKAPTKPDTGAQAIMAQRLLKLSPFAIAGSANAGNQ